MTEESRSMPDRVRYWIIVIALLALAAALLKGSVLLDHDWEFPPVLFTRGDYDRTMDTQGHSRILSIYIGLAARDVAGADLESIYAPADLQTVADRDGDEFQGSSSSAFNRDIIDESAGALLVSSEYDTVLSASELDALRAKGRMSYLPRDVIAVGAGRAEDAVVLFTDGARQNVYVVAASLAPRGVLK